MTADSLTRQRRHDISPTDPRPAIEAAATAADWLTDRQPVVASPTPTRKVASAKRARPIIDNLNKGVVDTANNS